VAVAIDDKDFELDRFSPEHREDPVEPLGEIVSPRGDRLFAPEAVCIPRRRGAPVRRPTAPTHIVVDADNAVALAIEPEDRFGTNEAAGADNQDLHADTTFLTCNLDKMQAKMTSSRWPAPTAPTPGCYKARCRPNYS
jgi:hypothetical protein